jgi:hypothetical protein
MMTTRTPQPWTEPTETIKIAGIPSRLVAAVRIIARRRGITLRQAYAEAIDAYTAGIVGQPSEAYRQTLKDAEQQRTPAAVSDQEPAEPATDADPHAPDPARA